MNLLSKYLSSLGSCDESRIIEITKRSKKTSFRNTIEQNKQLLKLFNEHQKSLSITDHPIVYFIVEGEKICILKSTLQEMIPNSQLTIRVASGRWEEQEETLDKDGNIIIEDIPRIVFKKIIEGIRRGSY
jgi:hypothetical protein